MEAAGLSSIQKAMAVALASAKGQIDAAIHGGSFLKSPELFVRVLNGPESASTGRAQMFESARGSMESRKIAQAAGEFDALTSIVVGELKRALRGSFLRGGESLNVKVGA